MRYVDEIKLGISGKEVYVAKINFRESFIKPYDELWNQGYLDIKAPFLLGNVVGTFRMSNYLPDEEVGQLIMRLRQYYDVGFDIEFKKPRKLILDF